MDEITHRQMRNDSAEVLRRVAAGEVLKVTNAGQAAAIISPPNLDTLALIEAQGGLRRARSGLDRLKEIKRRPAKQSSADIVRDVRGRW